MTYIIYIVGGKNLQNKPQKKKSEMKKMSLKRKNLTIVAICGDKCQMFNDDGIFIRKTEIKPLNELPDLIYEAKVEAFRCEDEQTIGLKTIITVPELDRPENLCLSHYAMHYITGEAIKEHWEGESEAFKGYIHKIQAGLF